MPMPDYAKDPHLNLYSRPDFAGIAYSDGAEVEERMLLAVESAQDRSVFSRDLARAITDWPTEYHFSSWRHCLLRPLGIKSREKVLELGCGCGAITRFLGEIGADVTAVDGSPMRARIASTRCQDLPNVRVIAEDLTKLELNETFDWILLVGVLEYAPLFCGAPDPARHYLASLSRYLAPEGRVVVAIENKLGLKYFNACGEDHLGTPFVGVQGLYGNQTQRTWGRKELSNLLISSGFAQAEFLYPFPDYKLPRVILTEAGLVDQQFAPEELLATMHARDYGRNPHRLFDEPLVAREIARNGLIGEMSNSFLVIAKRERDAPASPELLAVIYAAGRIAAFATQTRIVRRDDKIGVFKEHLFPDLPHEATFAGLGLRQVVGESTYLAGPLAVWRLVEARARRGGVDEIVAALLPWFEFLLSHADGSGSNLATYTIGRYGIDLTPFNIIETPDGLKAIDQEWALDRAVALGWVVSRCIAILLADHPGFEGQCLSIATVLDALCKRKKLHFSTSDAESWADLECEYMKAVLDIRRRRNIDVLQSHRLISLPNLVADQAAALSSRDTMLAEHGAALGERDERIGVLEIDLAAKAEAASAREKESAELRLALAEKHAEIDLLVSSLSSGKAENATLRHVVAEKDTHIGNLDAVLAQKGRMLSEYDARIGELNAALSASEAEKNATVEAGRIRKAETIGEIVTLTRLLREKEDDAEWLHQVAATLVGDSRPGRLAALMPGPLASMFRNVQLRRRNLFDGAAYLRANPDVARAGGDALRHYIIHGLKERRARR